MGITSTEGIKIVPYEDIAGISWLCYFYQSGQAWLILPLDLLLRSNAVPETFMPMG